MRPRAVATAAPEVVVTDTATSAPFVHFACAVLGNSATTASRPGHAAPYVNNSADGRRRPSAPSASSTGVVPVRGAGAESIALASAGVSAR
jgi:hypothetical protein